MEAVIESLREGLDCWKPSAGGSKGVPAVVRERISAIRRRKLTDAQRLSVACCLLRHATQAGLAVAEVQRIFKSGKERTADDVAWLWFLVEATDSEGIRTLVKPEEQESLLRCALLDTWPKSSAPGTDHGIAVAAATRVLSGFRPTGGERTPTGDLLLHALAHAAIALGMPSGETAMVAGFVLEPSTQSVRTPTALSGPRCRSGDNNRTPGNIKGRDTSLRQREQELKAALRGASDLRDALAVTEQRLREANVKLASAMNEVASLRETLAGRDDELDACKSELSRVIGAVERAASLEAKLEAANLARQQAALEARDAVAKARLQAERHALTRCMQMASTPLAELERLGDAFEDDARSVLSACLSQLRLAIRQSGDQ